MARNENTGATMRAGAVDFAEVFDASSLNFTPEPSAAKASRVIFEGKEGAICMTIKGRELWALQKLIRAGAHGLTSIERPAPRWSHYIFQLRARGLNIETIREEHGGEYPGHHERYVLHTTVAIGGGA
jgi:hypothetical protein